MALSLKRLERVFLPYVEKPDRYIGGEPGLPRPPSRPILRAALAFPDLYELGMSYLGLRILLHAASRVENVACDRVFMPWFDAADRLRSTGLPLFTLESKTPLKELDLLGVNIQYELHATNILALLELGGIPLRSEQRGETDPVILGGGPLAFHPEPFAPFFDAIAIGDGEEVFPEILEALKTEILRGSSRKKRIRALGDIPGVYLPGYYQPRYTKGGKYRGLICLDSALPLIIRPRITTELRPDHYPKRPIVPTLEATHNRLVLEIARGCSRGCRFCGPGMVHRPARERPVADLVREARNGLAATGYSEVSLLSLSTADFRYLVELLDGLEPLLEENRASLSFPSLRPDLFTEQMAERASVGSRTGLTFAPEAATPRLRAVVNKETSDEALLKAARLAYERGWKLLKLYFMVGLPTEKEDDVRAIVGLVRRVEQIGRTHRGGKLNVSISPFSPRPHTPFEREGQMEPEELGRRIALLRRGLRKSWMTKLEIRAPDIARVETAIARSDRRGADVIEASFRSGGLFDAWRDGFSVQRWEEAFRQAGFDLGEITGSIQKGTPLPWEHIDVGVTAGFLHSEREAAAREEFTADCRQEGCQFCGLQDHPDLPCPDIPELPVDIPVSSRKPRSTPENYRRYRLIYHRGPESRFHSHLSVMGVLERALRRLGVPLEFTQGFKPHVRLVASPPLAVGITSQAEYLDFGLAANWSARLLRRLKEALPFGFQVLKVIDLPAGQPSIGALDTFLYKARGKGGSSRVDYSGAIESLWAAETIPILRTGPRKARAFDARPSLWKLEQDHDTILIGIKASGGPIPRSDDILRLLLLQDDDSGLLSTADILAAWDIERLGMWWDMEGVLRSPAEAIKSNEISYGKAR